MRTLRDMLLTVLVATVVISGFAWPLGYGQWSLWPLSHAWHMFGFNGGSHYQLALEGELSNGKHLLVPMERWFSYEVTPFTQRYNEIARDPQTIDALVAYVCRKYNEDAPADARLAKVTVRDFSWPIEPGRRVRAEEAPGRRAWTYAEDRPCGTV